MMDEAKPGHTVDLDNLKGATYLNGTRGTLLRFIPKEERWSVRCRTASNLQKKVVCVKPANLTLLYHAPSSIISMDHIPSVRHDLDQAPLSPVMGGSGPGLSCIIPQKGQNEEPVLKEVKNHHFDSVPSAIFCNKILFHLSSDDYLSLRLVSKWFHTALHQWEESDHIWKVALQRDFQLFPSPNNLTHHLQTLRYQPCYTSSHGRSFNKVTRSLFGYNAHDALYVETTCFNAWKQWKKISKIYYEMKVRNLPRQDDWNRAKKGIDERVKGRNVNAPYFIRAAIAWSKVERWLHEGGAHASSSLRSKIQGTLMNGVSHNEGRFNYNCTTGCKLFPTYTGYADAFEAIFAFYDGQSIQNADDLIQASSGLIGGYSAYNDWICTHLLDTKGSTELFRYLAMGISRDYMPIARTTSQKNKVFQLEFANGDMNMMAVDRKMYHAVYTKESRDLHETGLVWFEEFTRRLSNEETGESKPIAHNSENTTMVTTYPTINSTYSRSAHPDQDVTAHMDPNIPVTNRAVTRGIEIIASAVFAPELGERHGDGIQIYSIRIRLLMPGEPGYQSPSERGFDTCQLSSRHWKIQNDERNRIENVNGEGVIGHYPLLREGGYRNDYGASVDDVVVREECIGTFSYQSCTGCVQGSFCGTLLMVPGSLREPSGDPFHATLAPFALDTCPKFLF